MVIFFLSGMKRPARRTTASPKRMSSVMMSMETMNSHRTSCAYTANRLDGGI